MKTAFLFPGQGAQTVGMGRDIAQTFGAAAAIYKKANDIVGYDLQAICFDGPQEKLDSTVVSQPAIFVTSVAMLEALKGTEAALNLKADVTAGLSLGEYTALYASGAMSFEDGLRLVQKRGNAMQAAADATQGSMVSILGLDEEKVRQLCAEAADGELLVPANFNCPGQIVLSGAKSACARAEKLATEFGAVKAVVLRVGGAFHSHMMSPAAASLRQVLAQTNIFAPKLKVIANIWANYYESADKIREGLARQLIQPILWQNCMEKLIVDGVETFYEIGPGRVLTGLMRKINRKANIINISGVESLKELSESAVRN
jgi:[acyl-carrier-protein] S-malonyltransferase